MMHCPTCGKGTLILETRYDEITNTNHRRRQCSSGHRHTTLESVAAVGAKRAAKRGVVAVPKSRPASADAPAQAGKKTKQPK